MRCRECDHTLSVVRAIQANEFLTVRERICRVLGGGCGRRFTSVEVINAEVPAGPSYGKGVYALTKRLLDEEGTLEAAIHPGSLNPSLD